MDNTITPNMKSELTRRHKFYKKSQLFFFVMIFVCIMLFVFFGTITLFTTVLLLFILLSVVLLAGIVYLEAKENRELIEEYMLFYGMNKLRQKNEKQKKTK